MEKSVEDSRILSLLKSMKESSKTLLWVVIVALSVNSTLLVHSNNKQAEAIAELGQSIDSLRINMKDIKSYIDTMKVIHPYNQPKK